MELPHQNVLIASKIFVQAHALIHTVVVLPIDTHTHARTMCSEPKESQGKWKCYQQPECMGQVEILGRVMDDDRMKRKGDAKRLKRIAKKKKKKSGRTKQNRIKKNRKWRKKSDFDICKQTGNLFVLRWKLYFKFLQDIYIIWCVFFFVFLAFSVRIVVSDVMWMRCTLCTQVNIVYTNVCAWRQQN